jgi:hypothetical protein
MLQLPSNLAAIAGTSEAAVTIAARANEVIIFLIMETSHASKNYENGIGLSRSTLSRLELAP